MNFKFTSPIGRTLESILADAKKFLRKHSLKPRRSAGSTKYPAKWLVEMLGKDLPHNADGQWSSPETTKAYVAEFERINHFRK